MVPEALLGTTVEDVSWTQEDGMKILQLCGPSHRDDGPPLYFLRALNRIEGVSCGRVPVTMDHKAWPAYDWAMYVDWGQDCFPSLPAPYFTPKMLCVQSDTHYHRQGFAYRMEQAMGSRIALMNQRLVVPYLVEEKHPSASWTPHAADHTVYTPPLRDDARAEERWDWPPSPELILPYTVERVPRWDWVFVGHLGDPGRVAFLDVMFRCLPDWHLGTGVFFEQAADLFHQAKIVLNHSIRGELNMRTFEVLASRSFMLTDYQDGMDELGLVDGVHCAIYRTPEEAIEKARYYLSRDGVRERIADAGWRWCLAGHTYWHRARNAVRLMQEVDKVDGV